MIPRALACCALSLLACNGGGPRQDPPREDPPREAVEAERRLAAASVDFGLALLREVHARAEEPNVLVSPLSVSQALGLALNGARGETFDALRAGLALEDEPLEELNAGFRGLRELLAGLDRDVRLEVANAVFPERAFEALPDYLERARDVFGAEVRPLDFADPASVEAINGWVSERTHGLIPEILERISDDEVMFLVNAVYFKGAWSQAFDPERTRPAPFELADGGAVEVPMMSRRAEATRYLRRPEVEAVELPYGNGAFTMVVLVPRGEQRLDDLIARLDGETWARWMEGLSNSQVAVSLPRLRLELGASLVEPAKALGMGVAFEPGGADFGRLAGPLLGPKLFISRVDHKTYLEVDEEGTTAAAVTDVGIGVVSMPPELRADRPFLLAIRERAAGSLLFLGAIGDPSQ